MDAQVMMKHDRVKHRKMNDWGMGEIISEPGEQYIEVLFENAGVKRFQDEAYLVKLPASESVSTRLDGLVESRSRGRANVKNKLSENKRSAYAIYTIAHLKDCFVRCFSDGFYGKDYFEREREYKDEAASALHDLLSASSMQSLIRKKKYDDFSERALQVINKANLIDTYEKIKFRDSLKINGNQGKFAKGLFDYLYGQSTFESRFNAFSDCLLELNSAKWTVATYFPFLLDPKQYMFLKPRSTNIVAAACPVEFSYRPQMEFRTYDSLMKLSDYLFQTVLSDLRPRDFIDVQSFIYCSVKIADGKYSMSAEAD